MSKGLDVLRKVMDGASIWEEDESGDYRQVVRVEDVVRYGSSEEPPIPYYEFTVRDGAMHKRVRCGD
jgi:hypothetical protein